MTKERGALIEAMARAAHTPYMAYNGISRVHVSNRMHDVLTAISEAGYAVVPAWHAMLSTTPITLKGPDE